MTYMLNGKEVPNTRPTCNYCQRSEDARPARKGGTGLQLTSSPLARDPVTHAPIMHRDICATCLEFVSGSHRRWYEANNANIEVLSPYAAQIVREQFNARDQRERFDFTHADELEQLTLTVMRAIERRSWEKYDVTEDFGGALGVQTYQRDRCITHTTVEAVPFTLAPVGSPREIARGERFWSGVAKVAKAAGVLRAERKTKTTKARKAS